MRCDFVAQMTNLPQRAFGGMTYFVISSKWNRKRLFGDQTLLESRRRETGEDRVELDAVREESERDAV